MTTVIKGGQVVSATQTIEADVLIDGEKVAGIAPPGQEAWEGRRRSGFTSCSDRPSRRSSQLRDEISLTAS